MKEIFINTNNTIQNALEKLQSNSSKCLIVTNKKKILLGTINDGDIRRAILKNAKLSSKILKFYKKNCYYIKQKNLSKVDIQNKFRDLGINLIPVVDQKKQVVDCLFNLKTKSNFDKNKHKNIEVIIMAGGLGTRLKPYTNVLPKPLLPYKNKTIIESVIDKFSNYGLENFIVSLNYKNILIKSFFKELSPKYKVAFLEETKPLGTAGALYQLRNKKKHYIISNCDVIFNLDYNDLIEFHEKKKLDITLVASVQINKIPYGVCKVQNHRLMNIVEKPEKNYFANTGLYIVNSKIFELIKKNEKTSFVELIKKAILKKKKIGVFPISKNAWLDLGQSIDFTRKN
jgi:dTDP-glucose pyrophosphorylase